MDWVGELRNLPERGARLGKPGAELMPGVGSQRKYLQSHGYPGLARTRCGPHRVVPQHLGVAGLEQQWWQALELAEHRGDKRISRIHAGSIPPPKKSQSS